ncbi:hypothetical protein [Snodgrassella alvi]|uniref:hypothetical protein n=1 Tax=Snodgrassella alvi TaxID=1196083 RepID=UPI000C1EC492|nr:hypothetical protein [Snodgrassella alvi]PIT49769.1 hypothetical protein BHC51_02890 [Snodgrassella alvi]
MSLEEDFRKLFGKRRPGYERTPNRPRLLGSAGMTKIPYGGDKPKDNVCLDTYALLHFNDKGQPSISSARAIEGLFEVETGRQVRVFLDPSAVICEDSDVKRFSDYIWYKLQLKNNHEAVLMGTGLPGDLNFDPVVWWVVLDVLDIRHTSGDVMQINPKRIGVDTLKDVVYKILKTKPLNAKAFFTTIPIKEDLLTADRDEYKKAVKQIFDFVCTYVNESSKYNRYTWLALYAAYQQTNSLVVEDRNFTKLKNLVYAAEKYAGKQIPKDGEMVYTWKTPTKPFIYASVENWSLEAKKAYWGLPADNFKLYESRWKFADDLVCGASLIKDYALQNAGVAADEELDTGNVANMKYGDHFIHSFDYEETGAKQYFNQDVTFYYRNKYDEDGNERGEDKNIPFVTLSDKGVTRLWSVDIFPDSAIIDLRFDPKTSTFIPSHPLSTDLIPDELNGLSGLSLKDENENLYSIALTDGGFLLHSAAAGRTWKIEHGDYGLPDKK